jgi:acetylglutamate kinase
MTVSPHDIAHILSEALPHMQRYDEETVVVKYGGHAMGEEEKARSFARDIVLMEQTAINPVVVHGGGPQIGEMLKRLGIKSEFAAGLRITDAATIEIVEMVLAGSINKQLVGFINEAGGKAVGLTGKDGNMVLARGSRMVDPDSNIEKIVDLGFVGEPEKVDTTVLTRSSAARSSRCWRQSRPRPRAAPTTSMPTPSRAPSPARSRPSGCPAHRRGGRARQVGQPDQGANADDAAA